MTFVPGVSVDDVNTTSTDRMIAGRPVLDNSTKSLLQEGLPRLEMMQQLHVKGDVGWIQQHTVVCLIG